MKKHERAINILTTIKERWLNEKYQKQRFHINTDKENIRIKELQESIKILQNDLDKK